MDKKEPKNYLSIFLIVVFGLPVLGYLAKQCNYGWWSIVQVSPPPPNLITSAAFLCTFVIIVVVIVGVLGGADDKSSL